mmetsp:Transcript_30839/g.45994  ORF Transcript_30839/g.45994 Transcript_30839/m.45994 type:complete len:81 (+) Transcript_30839:1029-1271(+)
MKTPSAKKAHTINVRTNQSQRRAIEKCTSNDESTSESPISIDHSFLVTLSEENSKETSTDSKTHQTDCKNHPKEWIPNLN